MPLPAEIFKAYDIRGIVGKTLTPEIAEQIGRAIGTRARALEQKAVCIGRDGRLSGPALSAALARGLQAAGVDVIDVGLVATPMLYFATHHLQTGSGVMVTGSHNPPDYNGMKIVVAGETLSGEAIQELRKRIEAGELATGSGAYSQADVAAGLHRAHRRRTSSSRGRMRIVVDCGNGVAGAFAPELYRRLGCRVRELFCEVDGNFPNHHPDPSQPENLQDLIRCAGRRRRRAGARLRRRRRPARRGDEGRKDHLPRPPAHAVRRRRAQPQPRRAGDLRRQVHAQPVRLDRSHGGEPLLWKTGHSLIKAKMKETGALLAGEMSGHTFFKERWYGFDDGLYAGARLLEYLSASPDIDAEFARLPDSVNTPELQIQLAEGENYALIAQLQRTAKFDGARDVITIDGLRVEYRRRLRPGARVQHHAGDRAALRGRQRRPRCAGSRKTSAASCTRRSPMLQLPF